jgi:hypothetical protein
MSAPATLLVELLTEERQGAPAALQELPVSPCRGLKTRGYLNAQSVGTPFATPRGDSPSRSPQ